MVLTRALRLIFADVKSVAIVISFLFLSLSVFAQPNESVWIFGGKKYLGNGFNKWKFDFVLDGRNSFIDGAPVPVGGLRMGLEYLRIHRFGIGFYNLADPIERPTFTDNDLSLGRVSMNFRYSSLYYERVLFFNPKWEVSATGHLGAGVVTVNQFDLKEDAWIFYDNIEVNPVELSTSTYYHLTWWFSLGAGVGYRWMLNTPDAIQPTYESTVYLAKAKVRLGKMLRAAFNKDVKNEY